MVIMLVALAGSARFFIDFGIDTLCTIELL
jgi:hypothetical protein